MAESIVRKGMPPAGTGTKIAKAMPETLTPPETNSVMGSIPSKTVKTKGGTYPVYAKGTKEATSFDNAFGQARKDGLKSFMWQGQKYNTKKK